MSFPTDSLEEFIIFLILLIPICLMFSIGLDGLVQGILWILSFLWRFW